MSAEDPAVPYATATTDWQPSGLVPLWCGMGLIVLGGVMLIAATFAAAMGVDTNDAMNWMLVLISFTAVPLLLWGCSLTWRALRRFNL
jgi:hypothetical protein